MSRGLLGAVKELRYHWSHQSLGGGISLWIVWWLVCALAQVFAPEMVKRVCRVTLPMKVFHARLWGVPGCRCTQTGRVKAWRGDIHSICCDTPQCNMLVYGRKPNQEAAG